MVMNKESIVKFGEKSVALCKRFPLALAFIVMLTIFILVLIQTGWEYPEEKIVFFGLLYLPTAALMALSFHLLNEEVRHKLRGDVMEALVLVGWLAYCGYLTNHLEELEIADWYLPVACIFCIVVSIFTLSFYYQKSDVPFWRFSMKLFASAVIAWIIGLLLTGGIALLFESFRQLFGWAVPEEAYASAATLCLTFIAPILFLLRIPKGQDKQDDSVPNLSKFYKGVIYFLFVPLLMCYLITLYLYAVIILIRWELPNGWVSWLTSFLMFGMLAVIFMVYPQQFHPNKNDFERLLMRWLPIMVIPLLVLMSIGIYRRITDYGISIDRLYLLLFNVWCYVVCFTLFVINSRRIWWIPASFCLLFFLTSIGPWSFTSITKRIMLQEIEEALTSSGEKLPMNKEAYRAWVDALPENKINLNNKLDYLSDNYGNSVRGHLVADSVWTYHKSIKDVGDVTTETEEVPYDVEVSGLLKEHPISIPQGYDELAYFEMGDIDNVVFQGDSLTFTLKSHTFCMPCSEFASCLDEQKQIFTIQDDGFLIVANDVLYDCKREILQFNGIIFKKNLNK